jgi:hypothetical protein
MIAWLLHVTSTRQYFLPQNKRLDQHKNKSLGNLFYQTAFLNRLSVGAMACEDTKDGGRMFLYNIINHTTDHVVS